MDKQGAGAWEKQKPDGGGNTGKPANSGAGPKSPKHPAAYNEHTDNGEHPNQTPDWIPPDTGT